MGEQETRRFQVDKEVAGSLVYLKQKIAAIFPELRRSEPVLSWVDEDGDEVVVTSDEELQVALTALTGPVYKLKVKLGDKAKDEGNSGMARGAQVHWGVVCDGCDGPVVGPRYKCLVCPDYDLCATCEARGLHVHHKMNRLPAPCKIVAPRCHLARQVNPLLGDPNIQMLANLFGERLWVNGCQGMRPAMPTTKNQARKAEPMDTKPAEKKPQTEKTAEAKKTECGEPSKPATTTEHRIDQTSADANRLPGIFADLTPLLGPLQAEQLSQFLRNFSAPQQNQEPEKKEAKEKQPEQQLQEQLGLANLEVLSPLSWGLQLWRQPSHFWRPSPSLARTILPRLARMVRNSLEKEITRQQKSKCQHKRKRPRKRRRRTLSQKRKRKLRSKTTLRKTQTSK